MRFVAGRGAVTELLLAGALWRKTIENQLLAGEPWRRAIGNQLLPRRRGEAVAGRKPLAQRTACRSSEAELHREELAAPRKTMRLHREANKRTQKEKGPEETLISLPSHFYLLPCERATRAGEVAAAIMQGLQGRLQQMQELRRALGIRQG